VRSSTTPPLHRAVKDRTTERGEWLDKFCKRLKSRPRREDEAAHYGSHGLSLQGVPTSDLYAFWKRIMRGRRCRRCAQTQQPTHSITVSIINPSYASSHRCAAFNSGRATNPVALPADCSFTPTHATMVRRKPIAATALIQPQQAQACGKIPVAPAAPPSHTSRDLVPWRFLDACRKSAPTVSASRRPKTCTEADFLLNRRTEFRLARTVVGSGLSPEPVACPIEQILGACLSRPSVTDVWHP
jgi:hypothetical protein